MPGHGVPAAPPPQADPRRFPAELRLRVNRKRYEEASGVLAIPDSEARLSGLVLVWALVDAGFQLFFSEPLTLGSLDPAKIGRGRARP